MNVTCQLRWKLFENDNVVIYTALFGAYDKLVEPAYKFSNCDFICYTDDKTLKSDIWDIRLVENITDPVQANREIKFLPHKFFEDYKYSIYIDSNIRVINNPIELLIKYLSEEKICIPKHFERACIYDELNECIALNKITRKGYDYLYDLLKSDGYPRTYGLGENNIIMRKHTDPDVIFLMEKWWDFFINGPKRDQLSLLYLSWKFKIPVKLMYETSRNKNKYFRYELHLNESKLPLLRRTYLYMRANRDRHLLYKIIYLFKEKLCFLK